MQKYKVQSRLLRKSSFKKQYIYARKKHPISFEEGKKTNYIEVKSPYEARLFSAASKDTGDLSRKMTVRV